MTEFYRITFALANANNQRNFPSDPDLRLQTVIDIDQRIPLPVGPFIMGLLQVRQDVLFSLRNNLYR
jgi:hypothetical protein